MLDARAPYLNLSDENENSAQEKSQKTQHADEDNARSGIRLHNSPSILVDFCVF
jgi:hypothetical protein